MRTLIVTALIASAAFAQQATQNLDRVFHLTNAVSVTASQELLTILRTVDQLKTVSFDVPGQSVAFSGTADQIAMTEWTLKTLDQPARITPDELLIRQTANYRYTSPGKDDTVRVFFLQNTPTPRDVQELLTNLRTVADIRYIFNYTGLTAIALRGTAAETDMAAWMVQQLDSASNDPGAHKFQSAVNGADVVEVFNLSKRSSGDLSGVLTALRTKLHIQKAFCYTGRSALVFRGTTDQLAAAERFLAQT